MRASAIEFILDFTTTALIGFALTAPLGVVFAVVGGWMMVAPQAGGNGLVTWGVLGMMAFMSAGMGALAACLASGVARRARVAIVLTALACALAAVIYAPTVATLDTGAVVRVVLLLIEAGLLVACAWRLKPAPSEGAR